ncbi:MAG: pyridoxal phosphate-dependent aminotransferase [bacterium]
MPTPTPQPTNARFASAAKQSGPVQVRAALASQALPDFESLRKRAFNMRWAECPPDVIPLTAADPDLPISSAITNAITRYVATPHLPYGPPAGLPDFRHALSAHFARTKSADADPSRVIATNSAASAIALVARALLRSGDEVVVQDPVDFLVAESVRRAGANVRFWKACDGRFTVEGLEQALLENPQGNLQRDPQETHHGSSRSSAAGRSRVRAIFVCNPHNPMGMLWSPSEVRAIAHLASERGIAIVSDEVWSDVVLDGRPFRSFAAHGSDDCHAWVVHGMSKGFAMAGLRMGAVIAPDRAAADAFVSSQGFSHTIEGASTLSQIAAIAALREGDAWRLGFLDHCARMRDVAMRRLSKLKGVAVRRPPEATFILFADVSATGVGEDELARRIERISRVRVVPGSPRWFGTAAAGHIRLSLATTHEVLDEALTRIEVSWREILAG